MLDMTQGKLTSLVMIFGLLVSLLHPLAHAQAAVDHDHEGLNSAQHGLTAAGSQAVQTAYVLEEAALIAEPPARHHDNDFATVHCEVCHMFSHYFGNDGTAKAFVRSPAFVRNWSEQNIATSEPVLLDRPPRTPV